MTTVLAFIAAIVLLVVIHELGHLWVARLCGVKVLRFSVGFGKVIYTRHFGNGETEWVISAVPLGGYVKMLDEREGEVLPEELDRAFNRKPVGQRMLIVIAGPLANFLLAILLYWALFLHGVPGLKPVVGEIAAQTPAAVAQMQIQDTIVSINSQAVASWEEVRWSLLDQVLQSAAVNIETRTPQGSLQQHVLDLSTLTPSDLDSDFLQKLGLQPYLPPVMPVIGKMTADGIAQRSGLLEGDHIQRVNGTPIESWMDFVEIVRSRPGQPLQLEIKRALEIEREGQLLTITMTPEVASEAGKTIGKIGAAPRIDRQAFDALLTQVSYGPVAAMQQALQKTWTTSKVTLKMLGKMILGEMSLKNLSGPLTIADYAGQSAQVGVVAYLGFLALVSISLGVLNMLPVPLLDGGHLLYYVVELIKGSPVSEKVMMAGQNVGIALLVTLMVVALYNDIVRLFVG